MIDEKLKVSGLTMTEFIIRAITEKPVVSIPNVGEIVTELKRQGNNLNQLAKANYFGMTTEEELLSALAEIKKLYAYTLSVTGGEECRFLNARRVRRLPKR